MRLTKGLIRSDSGPSAVRDTPISEAGFVGAGVGAAAAQGSDPVVDLMYVGLLRRLRRPDRTNNAAKIHYMFGGKVNIPLTIMTGTSARAPTPPRSTRRPSTPCSRTSRA